MLFIVTTDTGNRYSLTINGGWRDAKNYAERRGLTIASVHQGRNGDSHRYPSLNIHRSEATP